jgi:uncharacterized membrane protein (UPF0127 family)
MNTLNTRIARYFHQRLVGLMFSSLLPADEAFFIPRCTSVHTCFMRYPIDLVYVDAQGVVTKLVKHLKPWRFSRATKPTQHVVELAAGSIARLGLSKGLQTVWRY